MGAGIANEAAQAGLAVALVDRGDFGGATSSASSKLIHGGLRSSAWVTSSSCARLIANVARS